MQLSGKSVAKQAGFTLIELIMVVVILGVLSAFALPRFGNFKGNAEQQATIAARSAVQSAVDLVHSQALIENKKAASNETITLEDGTTTIALAYGYPDNTSNGIQKAVNLSGFSYTSPTFSKTGNTSCTFDYASSTGVGLPPVIGAVNAACK